MIRAQGLGLRAKGLGLRVEGLEFRVRVQDLGSRVYLGLGLAIIV